MHQVLTIFNLKAIFYVNVAYFLFLANVIIFYPLKTPEKQSFSGVFGGYKLETMTSNGLVQDFIYVLCIFYVDIVQLWCKYF